MAIVTFYNCDPQDAPKTTMPAHLGANGIFTCKGKLLLEKRRDSDIWGLVGGGCKKTETGRNLCVKDFLPVFELDKEEKYHEFKFS